MENGLVRFKERDVTDLLTLYGITDEQKRSGLVTLTRQANTPGWWSKYGDIMADWFEAYLGLETAASVIRTFELQFVHGLFQTEDYARAVTMLGHTSAPADEIERRVSLRLKRQDLLRPRAAAGVVGDRRGGAAPPGGRRRGDAGSAGPPRRGGRAAPRHHPGRAVQPGRARRGGRLVHRAAFQRARGAGRVYIEQLTSALYLDKREDVDHYLEVMNHLSTEALTPARACASSPR